VSYLYGKTQPNFVYIEEMLSLSKNEFIEKLLARCEELDFAYLAKDVESFLIESDQSSRVIGFEEFIKKQLIKN